MPHEWNNVIVVTKEELVPAWYSTWSCLKVNLHRYKDKPYGIKRVRIGGNGRELLINFDSLEKHIQDALGDPRKCDHLLEPFYRVDREAVTFFSTYKFDDGTYLSHEHQEKYIVNASVLGAIILLRAARLTEWSTKGRGSTKGLIKLLCEDAASFNKTLKVKHNVEHSLPESEKHFKRALNEFEKDKYITLISSKHRNSNSRKVYNETLSLLECMFSRVVTKPTATEVHRRYDRFLKGSLEIIDNNSGEVFNPADYKTLSVNTVTNYLSKWDSRIGTYSLRSGDRQSYMQQFKPHHSLKRPELAGSILSIDDRQPPFKMANGKRVWFYMGIDLASEAWTSWVFGKSKEGIIMEFYRKLVCNYAQWGYNLPHELECESSLNSSFKDTFLREGAMFQKVRIEANNARGKRIEAYFKPMRYEYEKELKGWLARPFAKTESNQVGSKDVPVMNYSDIIDQCLRAIEAWNNSPHSVHKHLSRWEVFCQMQNPDLLPTNYNAILPHIGKITRTSCKVGIIQLNDCEYLLGENEKIATGEKLIRLMREVEGNKIDVYWLENTDGEVIKAQIYLRNDNRYICEAIKKPRYSRAKIEQTETDHANRAIMSAYVATIEAFGRSQRKAIEQVTLIDRAPAREKSFVMPGIKHYDPLASESAKPLLPLPEEEDSIEQYRSYSLDTKSRFMRDLKDRY